jgi:glycosyltransferase involved in cell wall biosynthesis
MLCEGLVERGVDVTLFATADSVTRARLEAVCPCPYEECPELDAKVWECLHVAHAFEQAHRFDLLHNHYDFLPLTYSRLVATPMLTTIHGFSSPRILPVYRAYADRCHYVSISNADRSPELPYLATVYHGIELDDFPLQSGPGDYLLYYGRIHPDKGTEDALRIARAFGMRLVVAGIIQDAAYFHERVEPLLEPGKAEYIGSVGGPRRAQVLGGAYALLHPIHFEEPFGLSVVEAMACGTPVVAYRRGAMPEVIADGETGFLVEGEAEALEALGKVGRLRRTTCRKWVEGRFSRQRMVDDYLEVYRRVLDGGQ